MLLGNCGRRGPLGLLVARRDFTTQYATGLHAEPEVVVARDIGQICERAFSRGCAAPAFHNRGSLVDLVKHRDVKLVKPELADQASVLNAPCPENRAKLTNHSIRASQGAEPPSTASFWVETKTESPSLACDGRDAQRGLSASSRLQRHAQNFHPFKTFRPRK